MMSTTSSSSMMSRSSAFTDSRAASRAESASHIHVNYCEPPVRARKASHTPQLKILLDYLFKYIRLYIHPQLTTAGNGIRNVPFWYQQHLSREFCSMARSQQIATAADCLVWPEKVGSVRCISDIMLYLTCHSMIAWK